ncbi:MAG TPA: TetR/AcrR family transcriptional regulator [Solirubrobacteraceae bacterium]|nr:TetR/AcrR family transcriptional regulator [Solirubrobacteraceae bacterium]
MEAAATGLSSEKAARIVAAMRASVASRGIAGSTFDHVAREAGVSRGLLHYYFGTKERLLLEVVRLECEARGELLDQAVSGAQDADGLIDGLVTALRDALDGGSFQTYYELLMLGQRNREIAGELHQLARATRERLAEALRAAAAAGVFALRADPVDLAGFLFGLADGIAIRRLSEPELSLEPLLHRAIDAARALVA